MNDAQWEARYTELVEFADRHSADGNAGEALMQFLTGECEHMYVSNGQCELCGAKVE